MIFCSWFICICGFMVMVMGNGLILWCVVMLLMLGFYCYGCISWCVLIV